MKKVAMLEIDVPHAEHLGVHGGGHGEIGACYDRAGSYMLDGLVGKREGYVLVHGTCHLLDGLPIPCGHAWVLTPSGAVYDGAADRFFEKASYYEAMCAVEERRYTYEEARQAVLREQDWGPWHMTAGLTKRDVSCECEEGELCPVCIVHLHPEDLEGLPKGEE